LTFDLSSTISTAISAVGAWFIYDLIREFKTFKKDTSVDIQSLKQERQLFQTTVRNAELTIGHRVHDLEKIHTNYSQAVSEKILNVKEELIKVRLASTDIVNQSQRVEAYLKTSFKLSKALNDHVKRHEKELSHIRIRLGDTTVFKSQK
jgi:hypothetical protein